MKKEYTELLNIILVAVNEIETKMVAEHSNKDYERIEPDIYAMRDNVYSIKYFIKKIEG